MSLTEAIITYHDLLTDTMADDTQEQLDAQLRSRGLFFGDRPLCTVLRPRFLTPEQYTYMRSGIRPLLTAFEKISHAAVADREFRAQFGLFDWEESLIHVDPGYRVHAPLSRLDSFFAVSYTHLGAKKSISFLPLRLGPFAPLREVLDVIA